MWNNALQVAGSPHTFLHHELPSGTALLSRLEDEPHSALQLRFVLLQDPGCSQQLGHVRIMSTRMHLARRLAPAMEHHSVTCHGLLTCLQALAAKSFAEWHCQAFAMLQ